MKNTLIILLLFLAFTGCKDDDVLEPDEVEKDELWQEVPSSIVRIYRDLVAIECRLNKFFVQTEDFIYVLDSSFTLLERIRLSCKSSSYPTWAPKYSENYAIFRNELKGFTIIDLNEPGDRSIYFKAGENIFGTDVFAFHHSQIVGENKFSTVSMIWERDTVFTMLTDFQINHTPGSQSRIEIIKLKELVLEALERPRRSWPRGDIRVFRNDESTIAIANRNYYLYQNNQLLNEHRYYFNQIFEYKNVLYAVGDSFIINNDGSRSSLDGIFKSNDFGENFDLHLENQVVTNSEFESFGNELIEYGRGAYKVYDTDFLSGRDLI